MENKFYTGIVVIDSVEKKVMLGKRTCDGLWTSPGGTSEIGEYPEETAIRELKEESNINIDEFILNKLNVQTAHDGNQVFVYYIDIDPKEFNISSKQDPDEEVPNWKWFKFDDLPKGLMRDEERFLSVITAIQHVLEGKENKIKGGKGDNKKASDFDSKQIKMGLEIEMEHTNDKELAMEIVLDHLSEDSLYYNKLNKIIVDPVKEKMELNKLLKEAEQMLESFGESIDKDKNPIEKNPTNVYNKGTTTKMDNVPKDKKNSDKVEDEDNKFVKYDELKESLSGTINEYNRLVEMKIRVSDPFSAPPGANVQTGPKGGYFYDTEDEKKKDDDKKTGNSKPKDLTKVK